MKSATFKLGDACEFIRGVTFDKAEATAKPEVGKVPILRAGNIGEELDAQNDLVWVPESRVADKQCLRRNDIAICMSSGSPEVVGKTARVPANLRASVGSFCGIIRPRQAEQAGFLSFYFRSPAFAKQRDAIARGANIQNLRFSSFEEIEVEIPDEQQKIARELEQADRLRRTRRYALELSDSFLPAAFLELFGDPLEDRNGRTSTPLEDVTTQITDGEHATPQRTPEGIKLLSARNIQNGFIDLSAGVDYVPESEFLRIRKRCWPRKGDVLMSCSGSIGRVATVPNDEPLSLVRSVALIRPNPDRVVSKYLEHYLRSRYAQAMISRSANQSSQANIFTGPIKALPCLVPPMCKQRHFAALVMQHERLRATQREALRQAEHLFQALLHQAFSEPS